MPENQFKELFARAQEGDSRAFELLVERYGHHVQWYIRRKIKKRRLQTFLDATAIYQSVLCRFHKALLAHQLAFQNPEETIRYLLALGNNRVADHARQIHLEKSHRAQDSLDRLPEPEDKGGDNPCAQLIAKEQAEGLRQNLTKAEWHFLQEGSGGDWQTLAEKTGTCPDTLRMRFGRLFQRVRNFLQK